MKKKMKADEEDVECGYESDPESRLTVRNFTKCRETATRVICSISIGAGQTDECVLHQLISTQEDVGLAVQRKEHQHCVVFSHSPNPSATSQNLDDLFGYLADIRWHWSRFLERDIPVDFLC